jgi:hypothetical protein
MARSASMLHTCEAIRAPNARSGARSGVTILEHHWAVLSHPETESICARASAPA